MKLYVSFIIIHNNLEYFILAKSGCKINNISSIVKYIIDTCPNLQFLGLMTIGKYGYNVSNGPNPDFVTLKECKNKICNEFNIESKDVKLSMGMSSDFEQAVSFNKYLFINKYIPY
jgi:uncharacterized pyridoxal phosphate-containing UPF0001 family protein